MFAFPVCGRTWQASHGRRPRLFVGNIPNQESRKSDQGAKGSIADANINSTDSHR